MFLPQRADNAGYRGQTLALWLFGIVVLVRALISLNSIFNGHGVASSADGVPLDSFGPAGAQAVISLFAIWGIAQFVICLFCFFVLFWYRALVPLMFALLLFEFLSRRLALQLLPIVTVGTRASFSINLALLVLTAAGLILSLLKNKPRNRTV